MDTTNDPIKALLEKTGLTCDDLLQKLLAYKSQKDERKSTTKETVGTSSIENGSSCNSLDKIDDASNQPSDNSINTIEERKELCNEQVSDTDVHHLLSSGRTSPDGLANSQKESSAKEETPCEIEHEATDIKAKEDIAMEHSPSVEDVIKKKSNLCTNSLVTNENEISLSITNDEEIFKSKNTKEPQLEFSKSVMGGIFETSITEPEPAPDVSIQKIKDLDTKEDKNLCSNELLHDVEVDKISSNMKNCLVNNIDDSSKQNSNKVSQAENTGIKFIPGSIEESKNKDEPVHVSNKRRSISDELVRRLVDRFDEDDRMNETEAETRQVEHVSQDKSDVFLSTENNNQRENDIEVCQIEDIEAMEHKPLLTLRKDLFGENSKMNFQLSDDECENQTDAESPDLKEFLKTVEEVTGDVETQPLVNEIPKISDDEGRHSTGKQSVEISVSKMRRIKVGFLKKKILFKAIRHINRTDSKKFEITHKVSEDLEEDTDHRFQIPKPISEVDTPEAQEEIRKNLKLQLTSLRNRRKTDTSTQNAYKKFSSIGDRKFNYKKQLLGKKQVSTCSLSSPSCSNINTTEVEPQTSCSSSVIGTEEATASCSSVEVIPKEDSLFSLSEETNFMIVDVQGGVDLDENEEVSQENEEVSRENEEVSRENEEVSRENEEVSRDNEEVSRENEEVPREIEKEIDIQSDAIKLTKTTDITKIKGWKNKKFDVELRKETTNDPENETLETSVETSCGPSSTPVVRDDSSSDKTIKIDENSTEELSPFVSNTLEEFLTENSTLNISYKIPKLGAEESFRERKYKTVVVPKNVETPPVEPEKKEKPRGMKPKTLAEKRRMLEGKISKKSHAIKEQQPSISKTSYVNFNGHPLFVPSTYSNKCLADIKHNPSRWSRKIEPTNKTNTSKKISLLEMWHQKNKAVSYKPGPLSKKPLLQNNETLSMWKSEVLKLPKVRLEIIPEVRKAIPPNLIPLLPKFGPIIADDRLEFALTALCDKSKDKVKTGFRFTMPYENNQKYILVRKKNEDGCGRNFICDINPEKNSVASIIDDLLTYVETKEIGDSIIKDADVYEEDESTAAIHEINDGVTTKKVKKRKVDAELQRLSCKVVSVTVDETEVDNPDCRKPHCRLGCVCRSLACTPRLPLHCLSKECVLRCKCSSNQISVTDESSLLSSDTVTRIEVQAKRFLAKVEKEFTQTIIHANDKRILIPYSDRSKTKRVKRTPKRYSDYFDGYDTEAENVTTAKENEIPKKVQNTENYDCFVELRRLDLDSITPWCMDHNCYDCPCISTKIDKRKKSLTDEESDSKLIDSGSRKTKKRKSKKHKRLKEYDDTLEAKLSEENTLDVVSIEDTRTHEKKQKKR